MTEALVTRTDVEQYVYDTLPWTETEVAVSDTALRAAMMNAAAS